MAWSPEEHETVEFTRVEKVLAAGLVLFLLVGGLWVLDALGRVPPRPDYAAIQAELIPDALQREAEQLRAELWAAEEGYRKAEITWQGARLEYEFRREEWRTALDAGQLSPEREAAYREALRQYEAATASLEAARRDRDLRQAALQGPDRRLEQLYAEVHERYHEALRRYQLQTFLLRLAYALPVLAASVWAWQGLRRRRSQLLLIGTALVAFAILQTLFLVGSYLVELFRRTAQLLIAVLGSAITAGGIVTLKRYIFHPDRLRQARARRGRCVGCGYELGPAQAYCPACGEAVGCDCPACGRWRPLHLPFCPACGRRREG